MSKKFSVRAMLPVLLCLLLVIGVLTVFHACERKDDGTWMHCHAAQNDVVIAGLAMFVVFVVAAFIRNRTANVILNLAGIGGSVVTMLIPGTLVGMCMMRTMRCYTVMQSYVRIMVVLIIISALINVIATLNSGKSK
ncbi:MAG: DUF4418 family protein [Oscillospiraceae bacterium]|nr:DUF4418 family protein [Oscillospiraceae bacterium]